MTGPPILTNELKKALKRHDAHEWPWEMSEALEFERRWTKHRTLLPTELGPWKDKCMAYYADFTVTFTRTGFEVRKRSDFATDEILAAVIQLAAEIYGTTKNHEKAEEN